MPPKSAKLLCPESDFRVPVRPTVSIWPEIYLVTLFLQLVQFLYHAIVLARTGPANFQQRSGVIEKSQSTRQPLFRSLFEINAVFSKSLAERIGCRFIRQCK